MTRCGQERRTRSQCKVGCRIERMRCNRRTASNQTRWSHGSGYRLVAYPGMMPYMSENNGDILIRLPDLERHQLDAASDSRADEKGEFVVAKLTYNGAVLWKQYVSVDAPHWTNRHGVEHWVAPFDFDQVLEQQYQYRTSRLPVRNQVFEFTVSLYDSMTDAQLSSTSVIVVHAPYYKSAVVINNRNGRIESDGVGFFPFGMYTYGVTSSVEMSIPDKEVVHGFNMVGPYLSEAGGHNNETWADIDRFLHRCDLIGMKVHYDLAALAEHANESQKWDLIKEEVNRVKNHSSIFAYYLADEPGGSHIPVTSLIEVYKFVKQLDPYRPITSVFCCVDPAEYAAAYDVGMMDPYPIPNQQVTEVSDAARKLRNVGKPFFIVSQAFGGGESWERNPSRQEERIMTYLAVINGAVGIQYFIRSPEQFPYAPAAWSECRQVALEILDIAEAVLTSNTLVSVDIETVEVAGWNSRLEGTVIMAAANTQNVPVQVSLFALRNRTYNGPVEVVGQNRQVMAKNGTLSDVLAAFGTAIYRFPPTQSPIASASEKGPQPNPRNILRNPSFEESYNIGSPDGAYIAAGSDHAATYFTDSFQSVHGLHSLRLVTPTNNTGPGVSVTPYPVQLLQNVTYVFSVWAKASVLNSQLRVAFLQGFQPNGIVTFMVNEDWSEFSTTVTATQDPQRGHLLQYELTSPGTLWLDLIQLIPY